MPKIFLNFLFLCSLTISLLAQADLKTDLQRLQTAYPTAIQSISKEKLIWADGAQLPVQDPPSNKSAEQKLINPSLADQVNNVHYPAGKLTNEQLSKITEDPGRIRYEPFFRKMYGNSEDVVKKNLVVIYWMPKIFGNQYPLQITTINGVDQKLKHISEALEKLPPSYHKYLSHPGESYRWRVVENTNRLSPHSFGMTLDINPDYSSYWLWDLKKQGHSISEQTPLVYRNEIPWEIVDIFEKYGFIWGGKWHHYDTMHFEYRPELFTPKKEEKL